MYSYSILNTLCKQSWQVLRSSFLLKHLPDWPSDSGLVSDSITSECWTAVQQLTNCAERRQMERRGREREKRCSLHPMRIDPLCALTVILFVYCSRKRDRERKRLNEHIVVRMQIDYSCKLHSLFLLLLLTCFLKTQYQWLYFSQACMFYSHCRLFTEGLKMPNSYGYLMNEYH